MAVFTLQKYCFFANDTNENTKKRFISIRNSSVSHGMKTKIFKNLTKNYTGIYTGSSFLLDF